MLCLCFFFTQRPYLKDKPVTKTHAENNQKDKLVS